MVKFQISPPAATHETHKDYEFLMFQQQYVLQHKSSCCWIIRSFSGVTGRDGKLLRTSRAYIHIKLPYPQLLFIDYDLHHSSIHNIKWGKDI